MYNLVHKYYCIKAMECKIVSKFPEFNGLFHTLSVTFNWRILIYLYHLTFFPLALSYQPPQPPVVFYPKSKSTATLYRDNNFILFFSKLQLNKNDSIKNVKLNKTDGQTNIEKYRFATLWKLWKKEYFLHT